LVRLNAVVGMSAEIDKAETEDAAVALLYDTIGILLDVPRIAIALPAKEEGCFTVHGRYGLPFPKGTGSTERLLRALPGDGNSRAFVLMDDLESFFPGIPAEYATCVPLVAGGKSVGMVAIFDMELQTRDALLMELLAARVAAKIVQLHGRKDHQGESSTCRLLAMINELPFLEDNERLYDCILDMAAELVQASCGSLMLIDKKRANLHIAAAKRMNMRLAKSLTLKLGSGIAGKVAASGHPLLVNDIEHDARIVGQSRLRFKSKSFISIPIKFREQVLGVLNLSDKENDGVFDEADLEMLSTFGTHASAVIRRSSIMERSEQLEHLSITDPLTELYNRRFLERRMEEELSRSLRQGLQLTVMLIDLDNFKQYNDLCGHIAGDRALQKVARILEKAVRDMDVVTRYGGEEFCLVLPGTAKMESIFVAERIRRGIEKESFAGEEDLPSGRLTASIGISSFPEDGQSTIPLINSADIALYQAKDQGRNRIVIYNNGNSREGSGFLLHAAPRQS
jgi:diguanylate cyclase (GGDEF)-like protein